MTIRLPARLLVLAVFAGVLVASFGTRELAAAESELALAGAWYATITAGVVAATWLRDGEPPPIDPRWLAPRATVLVLLGFAGIAPVDWSTNEVTGPLDALVAAGYAGLGTAFVLSYRLGRRAAAQRYLLAALLTIAVAAGMTVGAFTGNYLDELAAGSGGADVMVGWAIILLPLSLLAAWLGFRWRDGVPWRRDRAA